MSDSGSTLAIISLGDLLLNSGVSGVLASVEEAWGGGDGASGTAVGSDGPDSGDTRQALRRAALSNAKKSTIILVCFTANGPSCLKPSMNRVMFPMQVRNVRAAQAVCVAKNG